MKTIAPSQRLAAQPGGLPAASGYVTMEEIDAAISAARWWRDEWLNAADWEHDLKRKEYKLHRSRLADLRAEAGYRQLSHTVPALAQSGGEKTSTKESNS